MQARARPFCFADREEVPLKWHLIVKERAEASIGTWCAGCLPVNTVERTIRAWAIGILLRL